MNNKLKSAELIPGSYGLPIIGELIDFLVKREEFYWQKHQDNGNIFKTSSLIFGKTVCLVGPEANRLVFKDAADRLSSRLGNKLLATISPDSVLLKDGEAHRTNRRLILPVFHQQAIASYFDTIQSVVTAAMADWGERGTIDLSARFSMNSQQNIAVLDFAFVSFCFQFWNAHADQCARQAANHGASRSATQGRHDGSCRDKWSDTRYGERANAHEPS